MLARAVGQVFSVGTSMRTFRKMVEDAFPDFLESLVKRSESTQTAIAQHLDMPRQDFAAYLSGEKRATIGMLYSLPEALRIAIAADFVGPRFGVVEMPGESKDEHDLPWLVQSMREVVGAVTTAIEAGADHRVSRAEGAMLEPLCDRAISILLVIRELARQAQREGVISIQRRAV